MSPGVDTFLGVLAGFVVLPEVGIARLVRDWWRQDWRRRRGIGRLAWVYAGVSLALGDEGGGACVGEGIP